MPARYDAYDKKMDKLEHELHDLRNAIDWINIKSSLPPNEHAAAKVLLIALEKKCKAYQQFKAKNEA